MAWLADYNFRKKITFSNALVPGALSDFPLVVKVDEDTDIGGNIVDTVNGYDVRFTSDDGETLLNYDGPIGWTAAGGEASAIFHVEIVSLSSGVDTDIYLYYGNDVAQTDGSNQNATFDANFTRGYHFNETISTDAGHFKDFTAGGDHAQLTDPFPSSTSQVNGKIDKAVNFYGVDSFITVPENADVKMGALDWTIEVWVKPGIAAQTKAFVGKPADAFYNYWLLAQLGGSSKWFLGTRFWGTIYNDLLGPAPTTAWTYVAAVIDRDSNQKMFIDGTWYVGQDISGGAGTYDDPTPPDLIVGKYVTQYYEGALEEYRISNIRRTDDWIVATYNNQNDPGYQGAPGFATWAEEESAGPSIPVVTHYYKQLAA